MTTKVTIDAHAGWDVKILIDNHVDESPREEIVRANTVCDYYIHDSQSIVLIEEVKKI